MTEITPEDDSEYRLREHITSLANDKAQMPIEIEGITLVARTEDRPDGEACETYAMRETIGDQWINDVFLPVRQIFAIFDTHDEIQPEPGALACYFNEYGNFTHVGRVTTDGFVESKWGIGGHVYKHIPNLVPLDYGKRISIKYFKD